MRNQGLQSRNDLTNVRRISQQSFLYNIKEQGWGYQRSLNHNRPNKTSKAQSLLSRKFGLKLRKDCLEVKRRIQGKIQKVCLLYDHLLQIVSHLSELILNFITIKADAHATDEEWIFAQYGLRRKWCVLFFFRFFRYTLCIFFVVQLNVVVLMD